MFPKKKLMMGPNNYGSFETPQKKKVVSGTHELINTNQTSTLSHKFDLLVSKEMANKEMEAVKSP